MQGEMQAGMQGYTDRQTDGRMAAADKLQGAAAAEPPHPCLGTMLKFNSKGFCEEHNAPCSIPHCY